MIEIKLSENNKLKEEVQDLTTEKSRLV